MGPEYAVVAGLVLALLAAGGGFGACWLVVVARDRGHELELKLRDATERSLRGELAALRAGHGDRQAAAQGVVDAALERGAPPGPDADRMLWTDDAARTGGGAPGAPAAPA